eukprot:9173629-Pyramimonas_sp.AAC.1
MATCHTTLCRDEPPHAADSDLRVHRVGIAICGLPRVVIACAIGNLHCGGDDAGLPASTGTLPGDHRHYDPLPTGRRITARWSPHRRRHLHMFLFSTKFENLEEELQFHPGTALIDFRVHAGERIDQMLARCEIARLEA